MKNLLFCLSFLSCATWSLAQSTERLLLSGWRFHQGAAQGAELPSFNDAAWQQVSIPHDWAISGPFDKEIDKQVVRIEQNGEKEATEKTGRSGSLPWIGEGWYRTEINIPEGYSHGELVFDGAMAEPHVWVDGQDIGFWAYGYNTFRLSLDQVLSPGRHLLAVHLQNMEESSRWYPGAGLYRPVRLVLHKENYLDPWETFARTTMVKNPSADAITAEEARLFVTTQAVLAKQNKDKMQVKHTLLNAEGQVVAQDLVEVNKSLETNSVLSVKSPLLWSPEHPVLYTLVTELKSATQVWDRQETQVGLRSAEYSAKGFCLNGQIRKFKGVCLHHDLGPLGAAFNKDAFRRQVRLLKEMGCDAIRTSHNMPAPELVRLCDEMGFMMMVEPFDEWDIQKCRNGYHLLFNEWAEKDMVNMLHQYRNSASVVMWSIGNEVPSQCSESGYNTAKFLSDICRREDPTRFTTCGMDQVMCVLRNGLANLLDVPGLNYRVHLYEQAYNTLKHKLVLGSETASTISSRGVYKFPVEKTARVNHEDLQCSSYDLEYCSWSNLPDMDFAMAEDKEWEIGQFVWTGFDYLGEPTPYNLMPNHSSNFGIIDLASIPKDRYWLYRSVWRPEEETLHVLPHWTWPGREGEVTPVFVYTNYPSAELFVNGASQGIRTKNNSDEQSRYRLMWNDVVYQPGEIKVVALDADGKAVAEETVRTAGEPDHLVLKADRDAISADGKDLAYVEVSIVDKDGNLCPSDGRLVRFSTSGNGGSYRASANGDPTCLDLFHLPEMHLFSGKLTAIVQASETAGNVTLTATADGIKAGSITISAK